MEVLGILREPLPGEDPAGNLAPSRLYTQAQIRVLMGDTQADVPGGPETGDLSFNFAASTGGFTVASEEPAYILGNYNASDAAAFGDPHASSAVIAETVTLLSKNWNNEQSMFNPRSAAGGASCPSTASLASAAGNGSGSRHVQRSYRVAIASRKSVPFASAGDRQ
jgi:hypothetical protein